MVGPCRKDGLRHRTVTNLTVTAMSHIFVIGAWLLLNGAVNDVTAGGQ